MCGDSALPTKGKRPYYRPTTPDQRRRLFEVYEETGIPKKAAAAAHVTVSTLYYWRRRFEEGGYAALGQTRSHRPHTFPNQLPESVRQEVIAAKREKPEWGRQRIADEVRKAHDWQAVISPSEVRRTLVKAGLWPQVCLSIESGSPVVCGSKGVC
jgi:transposase